MSSSIKNILHPKKDGIIYDVPNWADKRNVKTAYEKNNSKKVNLNRLGKEIFQVRTLNLRDNA